MSTTKKNLFLSIALIVFWSAVVFIVAYPSEGALTPFSGIVIFCIGTLFIALVLGLTAVIVRFYGKIDPSTNFYYCFSGILNLSLGFIGLFWFLTGGLTELNFVLLFGLSLLLGLLITSDLYRQGLNSKAAANKCITASGAEVQNIS